MKDHHLSRHDESGESRCECQLGHDSCRKAFNIRMAGSHPISVVALAKAEELLSVLTNGANDRNAGAKQPSHRRECLNS